MAMPSTSYRSQYESHKDELGAERSQIKTIGHANGGVYQNIADNNQCGEYDARSWSC